MRIVSLIIPLVGYFVAEQLWGPVGGLCAGVIICLFQAIYDYVKKKSFDRRSTLTDIAILLAFAICEFLIEHFAPNASALASSAIILALLVFSLFPGKNVMNVMTERVMPGRTQNAFFQSLMRQSLIRMTAWALFATAFYAIAFFGHDTRLSVWIDEYLLITVLLGFFSTELIWARMRRKKYKDVEWVQLVNDDGNPIGGAPRPLVHNGSLWLHAVVHLHVFNTKGELLLQLRPKTKKIQPGRWDTAVGGHIALGETLAVALKRETAEEIGLQNFSAQLTRRYVWKSEIEHEYVFVFKTESNGPFNPLNIGEVDELRFWSKDELLKQIGKGTLTPNLEQEIKEGLF